MNEYNTFPLSWPAGWPRSDTREQGRFTSQGSEITVNRAVKRVLAELGRMNCPDWNVIISTNLEVKRDGLPYANQRNPSDPGVAVYFRERDSEPGEHKVIPCDRFTTVAQNLAAVAGTVEALRRLDRYGSGIMERAFTGFTALPHLEQEPWYVVLNLSADAPPSLVERQYKIMRSEAHPDKHGGDATQFQRIQEAMAQYRESA